MTEIKINSHILKITGKVEVPQKLTSGHNYKVTIEGAVPKMETSDNENGTFDITYTLKPIKVEFIDETGLTIKAKDPRRNSELARTQARAIWLDKSPNVDQEVFYDAISGYFRSIANQVADELIKQNNW